MKRGFCQRRQDSGRPAVSGNMPFFPLAALLLVFGFRSSLFPVWWGLSSAHKLHVQLLVCSWPQWWWWWCCRWCPVLGERAEPVSVTARSTRACLASPSLLVVIKLVQMVSFWIKKNGFFWWKGCDSAWELFQLPEIRVTFGSGWSAAKVLYGIFICNAKFCFLMRAVQWVFKGGCNS